MDQYFNVEIDVLDLSVRTYNSLKRTGITTIGEVLEILERGPNTLLMIRNFGERSLNEVIRQLKEKGYWPDDWEDPNLGVPEPK
jgi:DNA-directed RNA polymerase subunit alpha